MLLKWLIYSTFFSVCSEAFVLDVGFDFKISYLIYFINLPLLVLLGCKVHYRYFICLFVIFFASAFSSYGITGKTIFQLFGISISVLYYYGFLSVFFKKYNSIEFFDKFSVFFQAINLVFFIIYPFSFLFYFGHHFDFRYHSIFMEPAHFCAVAIPVLSFLFYKYKQCDSVWNLINLLFLLFTILLSMSSVGILGLALLVMFNVRLKNALTIPILLFVVVFLFLIYFNIPMVKMRVDDSINALTSMNVSDVNYSTYALVSNLFVTMKSFFTNPLFGSGLGNHELSYSEHILDLDGIAAFVRADSIGLNAKDANSLFLRTISETGIFGVGCFFIQVFLLKPKEILYFYDVDYMSRYQYLIRGVRNGCLIYIFLKLFREGHWFSPEMYFLFFIYYYSKAKTRFDN
ncbi:hypothetical protein [uncultured Tolumonas sp.]|uniref:hypothetical protein n=1 Tax=uncultured Tolumonas sp. TaxID=263765 RepID=UPI00292ECAE1|nr:hypothetical protein [uncultured Tolumonas sp.]